jgi:ADP-ribosyl-[dinitrogen reductase] hydrolase
VGLAVGDAVGTTLEFKERGEFLPINDMVGGGPFRLEPGQWTDDTSMALCLGDSIISKDTIDSVDILERFVAWWQTGNNSVTGRCFDIGTTTREALKNFQNFGYLPALNAPHLSGNGSIMRLAPVAIRWYQDAPTAVASARLQSLTTHGSDECLEACATLAQWIIDGIHGRPQIMNEKLKRFPADLIEATGYVGHTMMAAQWAVLTTDNFRDAILAAANLGYDADTTAAVAGQIAGAKYGMAGIPQDWLDKVYWLSDLIQMADNLFDAGT